MTTLDPRLASLLVAPGTHAELAFDGNALHGADGSMYRVTASGIPLFAETPQGSDAQRQQSHYDRVAAAYTANLGYAHTQEYMRYLDDAMLAVVPKRVGTIAELCCGHGESHGLLGARVGFGVGVDISHAMLESGRGALCDQPFAFVQGDATNLPLRDASFDAVFMLGGIHHVRNREALFSEVARILRPGARFYFREPVSDFALWRWLRAIVYRLSPALDHETERPLLRDETVPPLEHAGLSLVHWSTHGLLGFILFMNSDVLIVNRWFRFIPGIRVITRAFARLDDALTRSGPLAHAGLQVIGVAQKGAS